MDIRVVPAPEDVVASTRLWIERAVIGLGLCPFARAVYFKEQVRYAVSGATQVATLLAELKRELRFLAETPADVTDTTLLIHPYVLADFLDYNDFIALADDAIRALGLAGTVQIASFHPAYQFAGVGVHDAANNTNRSPYPMLQLLRETSVDRAVAAFPDARQIYQKNIETMRRLGASGWAALGFTVEAGGGPIRPMS